MSLLTDIFGPTVLSKTLPEIKQLINKLPPTLREKRSYLIKDYAAISGIKLTTQDFIDIGG